MDKGLVTGYPMRFKGGKIADRLNKVGFSLAIFTDYQNWASWELRA